MQTLETIESPEALARLKGEWDALLARCPHRTPFLTHGWVANWWRHFGAGKRLSIVVVRDAGEAVLIAPLMTYRGRLHDRYAPFPLRVLETIANPHSHRADFVFAELRTEVLGAFWDHLLARDDWHVLRLHPVVETSPTLDGLRRLLSDDGVGGVFTRAQSSPYVTVREPWEAYERGLPRNLRKNLRRAARGVTLGFEVAPRTTGLAAALADVFEVSRRGWAAAGGTAITSTAQLRGFYSDLARLAAAEGWLFLCLLKIEGRTVAYEYNLRFGQSIYALKVAYDPAYARRSPGHLLTRFILGKIFQGMPEVREYDMLGQADPYKLLWTAEERLHVKACIYHPRSRYARAAHRLHTLLLRHPAARGKLVWNSP